MLDQMTMTNAPAISLKGSVYSSQVDDAFLELYSNDLQPGDTLNFDLKDVTFFDIVSMSNLLIQSYSLLERGIQVRYILPKSEEVLHFLVKWNIDDALYQLINVKFYELLNEEDSHRFYLLKERLKEKLETNRYESVVHENFYPFRSFKRDDFEDNKSQLTNQLLTEWSQESILSVLERHLSNPNKISEISKHFPGRIVFESITNSLRHPNCGMIQTASRLFDGDNRFTVTFWDNGDSIVKTLSDFMNSADSEDTFNEYFKESFRHIKFTSEDLSFQLKYKELKIASDFITEDVKYKNWKLQFGNNSKAEHYLSFDFLKNFEYVLLLAAFLPGVTSDPFRTTAFDGSDLNNKYPGLGLCILLDAVCNLYGGKLAVRTSRYLINLERDKSSTDNHLFKATIKKYPEDRDHFVGNLIAIHLPLKTKKA